MKKKTVSKISYFGAYTHPDECFDPISEYLPPTNFLAFQNAPYSWDITTQKMKDKGLAILVFRIIATHLVLIAFTTQSNATSLYLSALNLTSNKLMHKTMASKITEMSKLKQGLQLHERSF